MSIPGVDEGRRRRRAGSGAGLPFAYGPGNTVPTFTRATTATYVDAAGVLQTALSGVIRDGHYIAGNRTTLLEGARTNSTIQNRDLTNAAWTASSVTVARITGADGVALSGSRLTATGANGTVIVTTALVHGSQARSAAIWVKRVTGSGNIQLTLDNGSTWTTITVTASYAYAIGITQTLANSQFGIRIVTNGDAVDVDYCMNEAGAFQSSAIATTVAAVTRNADMPTFPFSQVPGALTAYAKFIELGSSVGNSGRVFEVGNGGADTMYFGIASSKYQFLHAGPTSTANASVAAAPAYGDTVELRGNLFGTDGHTITGQSLNAAAESTATDATVAGVGPSWSVATLFLGTDQAGSTNAFMALVSLKVAVGIQSLVTMRSA